MYHTNQPTQNLNPIHNILTCYTYSLQDVNQLKKINKQIQKTNSFYLFTFLFNIIINTCVVEFKINTKIWR